jgi:HK97 family phage major capsid protein
MAYNSVTSRDDVQALIREQVSDIMLGNGQNQSAAMNLFQRLQVPTSETRFPILSALPTAYWVDGDTGLKQTTEAAWDNKYIYIEKLAAIVPIPDSVMADASFDIWGQVRPLVEDAIVRAIDSAIFFGVNAPSSFPSNVTAAAVSAGNVHARGTATSAQGGIAEDINQLMGLLLADGYSATGFVGNPMYQTRLRGARGTDGQLLTDVNAGVNNIWGQPTVYPMPGLWPPTNTASPSTGVAELFALQRENFILGTRGDFEVTVSNTAVLQNGSGVIQYNAFQQDMTFFRIVFRVGWQVANPINYSQGTEAARYPAAVLRSPNIT